MASNGTWKWVAVFGAMVLSVPLVCCVASAGLEKLFGDNDPGGRAAPLPELGPAPGTPEYYERRQRPLLLARMSPSRHVASARTYLAIGWDPWRRTGGRVDRASEHLAQIPANAPEAEEAGVLRAEVDARMNHAGTALANALNAVSQAANADITRPLTDFFVMRFGAGRFVRNGATLRLDHPQCGDGLLDTFIAGGRDSLRSHGVSQVGCATGALRRL